MSNTLDVSVLLTALKNNNNEAIMDLNNDKINQMKIQMLDKLNLPDVQINKLLQALDKYRYVDELPEINFGSYVRWIPLKNVSEAKLTGGGIVCDVKIDEGISIVCKNFQHKHFQFKMGECLIFQKLSKQEQVLLSALDYLKV